MKSRSSFSLTPDQTASYQKEGFLVLPQFISPEECSSLQNEARSIIRELGPQAAKEIFACCLQNKQKTQEMHYYEKKAPLCLFFDEKAFQANGDLQVPIERAVVKISHALHDLNPVFAKFSRRPKIADLVAGLGLVQPLLIQSMFHFKHAYTGGEVYCHQDGTYIFTEPDTTVGLWFALEDASEENGCLWAIPGGHNLPLKYRFVVKLQTGMHFETIDDSPWELERMIPLEVPKGSLIVLHSRLPHMSKANTSGRSRNAYTLHLIDAQSRYPLENWLQRPAHFPARGFQ